MVFLIKASIVIFILLVFYKLVLGRESFFTVNRFYLLTCLFLAVILPFITLPKLVNHQGVVTTWLERTASQDIERTAEEPLESETISPKPLKDGQYENKEQTSRLTKETKDIGFYLLLLYIFGVTVLSAHLIAQLIGIFLTVRKTSYVVGDVDCTIVSVTDDNGPRSFFRYIFINPEKYKPETYEQILQHEKIHVKKFHSIDLLLAEIAIIALWFNPFIWLFRREVENNIEYQTDALVLQSQIVEPKNYQMNLIQIAVKRKPLAIVSNYNQSLIKKRIIMMNKKKSNAHSYWKYAFIAPTLFVTLLLLNQPFSMNAQPQATSVQAKESEEYGGSDYEADFDNDRKPLLQAAWTGDYELVKKLVVEGEDINQLQDGEGTALVLSIRQNEFKIARFLLENGANPSLGTNNDGHPLWLAARAGDIELVRLLISKGADVNTKFNGDGSALIQACKIGNLSMSEALIELKADVNMEVKGDGNPLIMAAKGGYLDVVELLVRKGADVNHEVPGDETPLINASEQGHIGVVKFLVEKGADVNKVCSELIDGKTRVRTALKMAEKYRHENVVKYLKSKGATN